MMNVERRTWNVERGFAPLTRANPIVSLVFPYVSMVCHRALENACECLGGVAASFYVLRSTFYVKKTGGLV